jgi:hypothetical protein
MEGFANLRAFATSRWGLKKPPQVHEEAKDPFSPKPSDFIDESFGSFSSFDKAQKPSFKRESCTPKSESRFKDF